jgi:hypothetical protein
MGHSEREKLMSQAKSQEESGMARRGVARPGAARRGEARRGAQWAMFQLLFFQE